MVGDDHRVSTATARVGLAGIAAMLLTNLVWDPAVTAVGVAAFGIAEEDAPLVRALWRVHPGVWLGAKVAVVGGAAAVMVRLGIHRDAVTAWVPWLLAVLGAVGPLGWLALLSG